MQGSDIPEPHYNEGGWSNVQRPGNPDRRHINNKGISCRIRYKPKEPRPQLTRLQRSKQSVLAGLPPLGVMKRLKQTASGEQRGGDANCLHMALHLKPWQGSLVQAYDACIRSQNRRASVLQSSGYMPLRDGLTGGPKMRTAFCIGK